MKTYESGQKILQSDVFSPVPISRTNSTYYYVSEVTPAGKLMVQRVGDRQQTIFEYTGKCYKVINVVGEYDKDY